MAYPNAWGLTFQEVAGLAWLAYKNNGSTGSWMIDGKAWNLRQVHEHGSFRAVLMVGEMTVLSFSGTDDLGDWADNVGQGMVGLSSQYLRAVGLAKSSAANIVVGHSLGGGLASYCAIYTGIQAATINPAPLNINPISLAGMLKNQSQVINYIAPGEALQILDALAPNMGVVGQVYNIGSTGGWNPVKRHLIGNIRGFQQPTRVNLAGFATG
jgi:pimeloyl-ACP methyl ester carboxylesterase